MDKNEEAIEKLLDGIDFKNLSTSEISGPNGLLKQLTKRLVEKAMNAEMTDHLGYEKHAVSEKQVNNSRNGKSHKTVNTEIGDITIEVPRDRNSEFEPQIIKKHQKRFEGFDDKIISMYSFGMTTRDIQAHLKDIYGVDVSPDLISQVTNEIMDDVRDWQSRTLDNLYPIVFFDALVIKGRSDGKVSNRSVYTAIGVNI